MPVTEIRREDLPKALQKKKITKAKYRRKYGEVAVLPITIFFLILSLNVSSAGLAQCSGTAPDWAPSDCKDLVLNGTTGIDTDVWLLSGCASGGNVSHYNWDGGTSKGIPFNCSFNSPGGWPDGFIINNSAQLWVMYDIVNLSIYDNNCTLLQTIPSMVADTYVGIATADRGVVDDFWVSAIDGWMQHINATSWAVLSYCQVPNAAACYELGISQDGETLYLDCGYQNHTTIVFNTTCDVITTWRTENVSGNTTATATTDGEYFWSWEYNNAEIVRWANDSTAPTLRNLGTNTTYMGRNWSIQLWGESYDACNNTVTWLESNESGTMTALTGGTSNTSINVCGAWTNTTYNWENKTYYCNLAVGYRTCAMDTAGNSNCSDISTFYRMPYLARLTGITTGVATCADEWSISFTATSSGEHTSLLYAQPFQRNATYRECNYNAVPGSRIEITNTSHYCIINQTGYCNSGETIEFLEGPFISGYPPSNLPTALAGLMATLMIIVYSYTTRR